MYVLLTPTALPGGPQVRFYDYDFDEIDSHVHTIDFTPILIIFYCRNNEIAHYSKVGKRPVNILICPCKGK